MTHGQTRINNLEITKLKRFDFERNQTFNVPSDVTVPTDSGMTLIHFKKAGVLSINLWYFDHINMGGDMACELTVMIVPRAGAVLSPIVALPFTLIGNNLAFENKCQVILANFSVPADVFLAVQVHLSVNPNPMNVRSLVYWEML